jgi:hypothetical protein
MLQDDRQVLTPRQWAPWITDPDPPQRPMTPEQMKRAAERVRELMIRNGMLER